MIYVYCPRVSDGARYLVAALGNASRRIQMEQGRLFRAALHQLPDHLTKDDLVVVWGQRLDRALPCKVLNAKAPIANKYKELQLMQKAGVPVPEFSRDRVPGWRGRSFHHQCGDDLLSDRYSDYFVKIIPNIKHELRMHVFNGHVFRTGIKIHDATEREHHPVFKTWNTGWVVSYVRRYLENIPTQKYWRTANAAVKALGYDFGAVDLGLTEDGAPVVFEVNSAPGLDGNTITRYAEQIAAYAKGDR